eukprot:NODE_372_length_2345_cov_328.465592_g347_i0.p1 GENE.NODE_372_length_2345_cov_328.465592_g347_i0~~NODE_372_length_2345_cov_328.465592_g347_i0.p1  ORF type:complete len:732 (-),score=115.30 NODE_372_length_2345_cov_328.465592_g347_i0:95-2290(-)
MRILLALLFVTASMGQLVDFSNLRGGLRFWLLNGKASDPCAYDDNLNTMAGARQDCVSKEVPDGYNTILLPSQDSIVTAAQQAQPNLAAGSLTLTITGENLVDGTLSYATLGGNCATIEAGTDIPLSCAGSTTACTFQIQNAAWFSRELELEDYPRKMCFTPTGGAQAVYTGWKIGVVWDCDSAEPTKQCSEMPTNPNNRLTPFERTLRSARTVCCRHTQMGGLAGSVLFSVGQCVNPNVTTCCQGALVEPSTQRCCNSDYELVQWQQDPCPCKSTAPLCPTGESCCTMTKYPELANVATATWPELPGQCFNQSTHRCCDTGFRYNPGTDQCCNITGVQSINTPCPCDSHADCQGGQTTPLQGNLFGVPEGMICCKQDQPLTNENDDRFVADNSGVLRPRCSKYANYPTGTSPYAAQRCLGTCMDNRYQICCNGVLCHREYDKCCNSTCCNKRVGTCMEAMRPGTPGNSFNYVDRAVRYEVCSTIEQIDPTRAFWIFVLPTFLLAATLLGVVAIVVFVNQSSRRGFSWIERGIITIAVATTVFALSAFFAPIYKYGIWVVLTCLVTMLSAAARVKWLNAVVVVLNFVLLMYLFDPFDGNDFFNFSSLRLDSGNADPEAAGLLAATGKLWRSQESVEMQRYCTSFYDYFSVDFQLRDYNRDYNPDRVTFGYCSRGWVTALLIFQALVLMLTLVQFVLTMIALILRFAEERSFDPIELEVRGADEIPFMMYGQ